MTHIIVRALVVYILTVLVTDGLGFLGIREWIKRKTPFLSREYHTTRRIHLLDCRLCSGFWLSLIFSPLRGYSIATWLAIYALSYFLTMQERR